MTPEQRFLNEGAAYFGARLIYRNQDVGLFSANGLALNSLGDDILAKLEQITDVEPKPTKKPKAKADAISPITTADIDKLLAV